MALEVCRRTGAGIHAVLAVESLRTDLVATGARPARLADAHAVCLAAHLVVQTAAPLGASLSVGVRGAGLVAVGAGPSWQALALATHMVALAAVLAVTLEFAAGSIESGWTRMLADESHVTSTAEDFTRDVIAALVACNATISTNSIH